MSSAAAPKFGALLVLAVALLLVARPSAAAKYTPPTPDSDCVSVLDGKTLKPSSDNVSGWTKKRNDVDKCFNKCRQPNNYGFIVENKETGDCYCYSLEDWDEWDYVDGPEDDIAYDIRACYKYPVLECPEFDQPGWIDQLPDKKCMGFRNKGYVLKDGDTYPDFDREKTYDGTIDMCKSICVGIIVGDIEIEDEEGDSVDCWWINHYLSDDPEDEENGSCYLLDTDDCTKVRGEEGVTASIYCGFT
mmetsp:Transcript_20902/g.57964  ORF Transcript_20902/g.57964 Transcript_20902/m.57964 type:complete len:246 (+) Transcript_20902:154-891(+)